MQRSRGQRAEGRGQTRLVAGNSEHWYVVGVVGPETREREQQRVGGREQQQRAAEQ
jgi:hypothetical protein